jgi:hypothetical protein
MSNTALKDINAKIKSMVTTMTVDNGYSLNITSNKIIGPNDYEANHTDPNFYPKVLIYLEDGQSAKRPSRRIDKCVTYVVVIILRALPESDPEYVPLEDRMEDLVDDFHELFEKNPDLTGLVTDSHVKQYTTDSGVSDPEGIALFWLQVEYTHQR